MSDQTFDIFFRESIWLAFDKKCFYCGGALLFAAMHIDHVLPEYLLGQIQTLSTILARISKREFDIRSPYNLVPAC